MRTREKNYVKIEGVRDFYTGDLGMVDVDPEIAETIKTLCEKGYETKASCAGHKDFYAEHGYISFYSSPPPSILPDLVYREGTCLRWDIRYGPEAMNKVYNELLEWANRLPKLSKELS